MMRGRAIQRFPLRQHLTHFIADGLSGQRRALFRLRIGFKAVNQRGNRGLEIDNDAISRINCRLYSLRIMPPPVAMIVAG